MIGRIYFLERGLARHAGGKLARRGGDCRLDVLRGRVNVAAEIELKRDLSVAKRAGRADRVKSGNRRKLSFERRGYGRSHRRRTAAGKVGGNLDGGIVDVGKIAYRQRTITDEAEQNDAGHDQGGRDRPLNKKFRH